MTRVHLCHETEGPKHDPYSVDYVSVWRHGVEHELKMGSLSGCEYSVAGIIICGGVSDEESKEAIDQFTKATGADPGQWMEWHNRAHSRCACGSRKFKSMNGYPGESFDVCASCGNVVNSYFHESEII